MKSFYFLRIWLKKRLSKFMLIPSYCRDCGRDVNDFYVDDSIWNQVYGSRGGGVLCYDHFAKRCSKKEINSTWKLEALD